MTNDTGAGLVARLKAARLLSYALKAFVRSVSTGGCKVLSDPDCRCPLCSLDAIDVCVGEAAEALETVTASRDRLNATVQAMRRALPVTLLHTDAEAVAMITAEREAHRAALQALTEERDELLRGRLKQALFTRDVLDKALAVPPPTPVEEK